MEFADISILGGIGLVGVCLYICIYAMLQLGILIGGSYPHSILSLFGASCVLTSLIENFNLSSAIIQATWITISILGIARLYFLNKYTRFNVFELAFIKTKLPRFSNSQAKRLFQMGEWKNGRTGDILTHQDQPIAGLCYLASGTAEVLIDGEQRATCIAGDYIGEITYLSGAPATGTVVLLSPATYFCIDVDALRKLSKFNNPLHNEIEKSIADDLRHKLARETRAPFGPTTAAAIYNPSLAGSV